MLEVIVGLLGTGLLGIFGWAFNLHSRVSVLEVLLSSQLQDIKERLTRIEVKMDQEHK
jgi:hypothetical protein